MIWRIVGIGLRYSASFGTTFSECLMPIASVRVTLCLLVGCCCLVLQAQADQLSCDDRKQLADLHTQIAEQQRNIAERTQRLRRMGGVIADPPQTPDDVAQPPPDEGDCP
jgi:hypothetical protein